MKKQISAGAQPGEDKKWAARSDFRTLSEARIIMKDKKRFDAALEEGKVVHKEEQEHLKEREDEVDSMEKLLEGELTRLGMMSEG
jgi:hypothetical protein